MPYSLAPRLLPASPARARLVPIFALLGAACGDGAGAPAVDASSAVTDAASVDGGAAAHAHDAHVADVDAASPMDASLPADAAREADAASDAGSAPDAESPAPDASSACLSYCTCMASSCADVLFERGCIAECAQQTRWDLECRQAHCGLQPLEAHCKHAHGVEQCFDR